MTAQEHIDELKRIAVGVRKLAGLAAKHERLSLIDSGRLEKLEELVSVLKVAAESATMTRDYKDVLEFDKTDSYNGKRFLLDRYKFGVVLRALQSLEHSAKLPLGCFSESTLAYDANGKVIR